MSSDTRSKVARLIDAYDLAPIGADLEAAWLGESGERQSLRDLADRFNRALLRSAVRDAGMDVVDGEIRNYYRLLTAEDVSAGRRVEAENRLDGSGLDVDGLVEDFVTYQAIRHYLTEVRGASYERDDRAGVDRERSVIDRLQSRVERVVRDTVDRLAGDGRLAVGDYRVFVSVDVLCEDCGGQYTVGELLDRGHCDCD
ncbi:rod-determining factor RdfA [Haloarcula laminariae]|uniref:rod-determining factor RdfA n=1 Tax=Haloarcula laminariae TaxID=2961577 RepID=UPI0021C7B130|nr:rod-determining factor RdfA [Halomicroarcula laminariae]